MGTHLVGRLAGLSEEMPQIISNARGLGLFAAFDVVTPELRTKIRTRCFERGLMILPCGERSIRFRPPLNVTLEEIDEGIDIIRRSISEVQ
jgi:L-lysine 6-transaminase